MIKRLFTDIAGSYDRMNRLLSLGQDLRWRRQAAALVQNNPARILDLACGTGDFAFALAKRFPDAQILGVDLTPAMLDVARAKNFRPNIAFSEGNAQELRLDSAPAPFTDATFSLVTCAFGFRNFSDQAAALNEAKRVLVPGGELLVLEFFRPESRLLGGLTELWLRMTAGVLTRQDAAYAYLRESIKKAMSAEEFSALARRLGLTLEERRLFFPCCSCLRFRS